MNDQLDWPHIVDEVETVGRSERTALRSDIATVLEHLIKLLASPPSEPRNGWMNIVDRARADIERLLADSPSLRPSVAALIAEETPRTARQVATALGRFHEIPVVAPDSVTFTVAQVLGPWLPGDPL